MWNDTEETKAAFFDNLNASEKDEKPKNGYVALYNKKRLEIFADSIYEAQKEALVQFNEKSRGKVKAWDISVTLCEKDNKEIIHTPDF